MRFAQITDLAFDYLLGRLLRRAAAIVLLALFALIAVYHVTLAGTLALEADYGLLYARLIVAAIYTGAALITLIALLATRTRPLLENPVAGALTSPRNTQVAMLIEAVMAGYTLGRKSGNRIR